jgi:hypothetical protein
MRTGVDRKMTCRPTTRTANDEHVGVMRGVRPKSARADADAGRSTGNAVSAEVVGVRAPRSRQGYAADGEREPLKTPPVPEDMLRWGDDGKFRAGPGDEGAGDGAGHSLPLRDSYVRHAMNGFTSRLFSTHAPLYETTAEETADRRKSVVKAALRLVSQTFVRMPVSQMIRVAADAAEAFLLAHRDEVLRFPLHEGFKEELLGYAERAGRSACQGTLAPPSVESRAVKSAADAFVLSAFHEVRESNRSRLQRLFARYDPARMAQVDSLLDKASRLGVAGAEEDVIRELVLRYGPEPDSSGSQVPTVVISNPVVDRDGAVHIFASVRGRNTDAPAWSLSSGNALASHPIGLDTLKSLGVVSSWVVSSTPLGEFDRALTLCLDLHPGAVRLDCQYTVHLALIGSGGVKARDNKTFFVESIQ